MKNMMGLTLMIAGLAVLPASAHEVGILVDKQVGESTAVPGLLGGDIKAVSPTGFGIRGAFTLLDLKVAELGVAATYHSKSEADLDFGSGFKAGKAGSQYIAIGAQVDWKFLVNLHVGVDMRREKISTDTTFPLIGYGAVYAGDTTITRPWAKAGIGFSVPLPVVSPFFRLEAAYALKTYSLPAASLGAVDHSEDVRKVLAPKYQIALYGGIRF